jgi:hypothetical protein
MKAIIHWDHKTSFDNKNLRFLYQYWDYTCRGFGMEPSDFAFVDLDGTLSLLAPPNKVVNTLSEALLLFPDCAPVYIHHSSDQLLPGFSHPDNPVYIVGPNYESMKIPVGAISVKIPAWDDLWGHVALGIVLYDRCK